MISYEVPLLKWEVTYTRGYNSPPVLHYLSLHAQGGGLPSVTASKKAKELAACHPWREKSPGITQAKAYPRIGLIRSPNCGDNTQSTAYIHSSHGQAPRHTPSDPVYTTAQTQLNTGFRNKIVWGENARLPSCVIILPLSQQSADDHRVRVATWNSNTIGELAISLTTQSRIIVMFKWRNEITSMDNRG